jgi:hypothetical protein
MQNARSFAVGSDRRADRNGATTLTRGVESLRPVTVYPKKAMNLVSGQRFDSHQLLNPDSDGLPEYRLVHDANSALSGRFGF